MFGATIWYDAMVLQIRNREQSIIPHILSLDKHYVANTIITFLNKKNQAAGRNYAVRNWSVGRLGLEQVNRTSQEE